MKNILCEKFFSILADRNRLSMISALMGHEKTVTELYNELGMEQSLVSHHLRLLKECGFVRARAEGKNRLYSLNKDTIVPLMGIMEEHASKFCKVSCDCKMDGWVMMNPAEAIDHETEVVMGKIDTMNKAIRSLGSKSAGKRLREVSDFFMTDMEMHFRMEEESLFPALEKKAIGKDLIASLEIEHKILREKFVEMRGIISDLESPDSREKLRAIANEISEMFRTHIIKEDKILLPQARKSLTKRELSGIKSMPKAVKG